MDQQLRERKQRGSFLFPFELYEMTDREGSLSVSCHWHPDTEILYLKEGEICLFINGDSYTLCGEAVIFINREEIHSLHSSQSGTSYDASVFPLEFLSFDTMDYCQQKYILPLIQGKLSFPRFIMPADPCFHPIAAQLKEIYRLHHSFPPGYQLATKTALFQILSCLIEKDSLVCSTDRVASLNPKKLDTMRQVISYINGHLTEHISLDDISSHFYMTPNYFCRFFKNNFGSSFTSYLNGLRLEKACILLADTDLPIMEISFQCGFDNFSYFIRIFKQKKGLTPSNYRKNASP